jgi:hypothetical protein
VNERCVEQKGRGRRDKVTNLLPILTYMRESVRGSEQLETINPLCPVHQEARCTSERVLKLDVSLSNNQSPERYTPGSVTDSQ